MHPDIPRRHELRACLWLAVLVTVLHPASAHASLFHGETLDAIANGISWVAIVIAPIIGIAIFWLVHILPEKIAEKKKHPQTKAIQCLCLLSLCFGGLLWPLAWLWAYSKPVLHKLAYGTDVDETIGHHGEAKDEKSEIRAAARARRRTRTAGQQQGRAVVMGDWKYDVISVGYPGPVLRGCPKAEPRNLAPGWVGFDFEAAFERPVKIINDAAMQALGSYDGGTMLFLGLGTGLGSALIVDGSVHAMELAHLPYKRGSYEDYVGIRGLEKHGKKKWRRLVADVVEILMDALRPEEVILGGGNAKKLKELPLHCRAGENADAFRGGFRLWEKRVTSGHLPVRIA